MINETITKEGRAHRAQEIADLQLGIHQNRDQIILQSLVTILFFSCGMYYARHNNIVVPVIMAPTVKYAVTRLTQAISERQNQIKRLKSLARE